MVTNGVMLVKAMFKINLQKDPFAGVISVCDKCKIIFLLAWSAATSSVMEGYYHKPKK